MNSSNWIICTTKEILIENGIRLCSSSIENGLSRKRLIYLHDEREREQHCSNGWLNDHKTLFHASWRNCDLGFHFKMFTYFFCFESKPRKWNVSQNWCANKMSIFFQQLMENDDSHVLASMPLDFLSGNIKTFNHVEMCWHPNSFYHQFSSKELDLILFSKKCISLFNWIMNNFPRKSNTHHWQQYDLNVYIYPKKKRFKRKEYILTEISMNKRLRKLTFSLFTMPHLCWNLIYSNVFPVSLFLIYIFFLAKFTRRKKIGINIQ